MPFSDQRVLDERNDRAVRTSSAESKGESCRYSSHEHINDTAKHFWPNQTILKLNSFDFIVVHVANDPLKSLHKNDFGFMIDNSDPT